MGKITSKTLEFIIGNILAVEGEYFSLKKTGDDSYDLIYKDKTVSTYLTGKQIDYIKSGGCIK